MWIACFTILLDETIKYTLLFLFAHVIGRERSKQFLHLFRARHESAEARNHRNDWRLSRGVKDRPQGEQVGVNSQPPPPPFSRNLVCMDGNVVANTPAHLEQQLLALSRGPVSQDLHGSQHIEEPDIMPNGKVI